jgi:DNA polymerase
MARSIKPSGPISARIAIVGDFPRQQDELVGLPFMSKGGQELTRMLADAGIDRKTCYLTTVFKTRPFQDDIKYFCAAKKEVGGKSYTLPPISSGKYIKPEYLGALDTLRDELAAVKPNIIIALGNVATWALLQETKITTIRGTISESTLNSGCKVLPTFHPASIFKQWGNRPIVLLDFMKAKKESEFPEIIRPKREIWIEPSLEDLEVFWEKYLKDAKKISLDIETEKKQITCIGFAPSESIALVVPFTSKVRPGFSYWPSPCDEVQAWKFVERVCKSAADKIGQNGLYDLQYLLRVNGIPVLNYTQDTMLKMHSLYLEMQKGLGFLASIFTNEASWKGMHKVKTKEKDSVKKDD